MPSVGKICDRICLTCRMQLPCHISVSDYFQNTVNIFWMILMLLDLWIISNVSVRLKSYLVATNLVEDITLIMY